ncbi:MAG: hypothetical protein O2797_02665 [Bacteroidetes bacterium]|nr:hypothetical protein [Bacteroidota bacterium]MDA1333103.1 hypothetical protein [Bacteroidota bacterium]
MKIEGFIVHKDIEGGFWGIQANDGRRFVPVNPLAEEFRKDGLPVIVELSPVQVLSALQWGEHVQIQSIDKLQRV